MNDLKLFLPCAAGVEDYLAAEVQRITGCAEAALHKRRGGVQVDAAWRDALRLNLCSRLAQRVLVQLAQAGLHELLPLQGGLVLRVLPKVTQLDGLGDGLRDHHVQFVAELLDFRTQLCSHFAQHEALTKKERPGPEAVSLPGAPDSSHLLYYSSEPGREP